MTHQTIIQEQRIITPQRIAVALCSLPQDMLMDPAVQTDTLQLQNMPVLVEALHDLFEMCWNVSPPSQHFCKSRAIFKYLWK